jgi:8-oxo-dGTP pyrophosphatase MutT (NUDIX family)
MKKFDVDTIHAEAHDQYGALCYRATPSGRVEVLLITSRDTGRWVIPKGWPMAKRKPAKAALREAYEEAGAEGKVTSVPAGIYTYRKLLPGGIGVPCVVTVFPVKVDKLCDSYPERDQRTRRWLPPDEAATMVDEPELAEIIRNFVPPSG